MGIGTSTRASGRLSRRRLAVALVVVAAALSAACQSRSAQLAPPQMADTDQLEVEVAEDYGSDIARIDRIVVTSSKGENASKFSVGWLIVGVLNELTERDDGLYRFFHHGDQDITTYLQTVYSDNPDVELKKLEGLASQGDSTRRLAARYALESLLYIPEDKDPAEQQAKDREKLIVAMNGLKRQLVSIGDQPPFRGPGEASGGKSGISGTK